MASISKPEPAASQFPHLSDFQLTTEYSALISIHANLRPQHADRRRCPPARARRRFPLVFDKPRRDALAMLFLRLHHGGVVANEIFWGLWLFPFGLLVYRSRFLPRILGVWLIINCLAYLAVSSTGLLFPQYEARVFNSAFPAMLGELAIMLWLLIKGAKPRPLGATASSLAAG